MDKYRRYQQLPSRECAVCGTNACMYFCGGVIMAGNRHKSTTHERVFTSYQAPKTLSVQATVYLVQNTGLTVREVPKQVP